MLNLQNKFVNIHQVFTSVQA